MLRDRALYIYKAPVKVAGSSKPLDVIMLDNFALQCGAEAGLDANTFRIVTTVDQVWLARTYALWMYIEHAHIEHAPIEHAQTIPLTSNVGIALVRFRVSSPRLGRNSTSAGPAMRASGANRLCACLLVRVHSRPCPLAQNV